METSYFAAQTMQSKVRFHFPELPPETHAVSTSTTRTHTYIHNMAWHGVATLATLLYLQSLRDSLMNHLQNLKDAPAPITRQVCDHTLSHLYLQAMIIITFISTYIQLALALADLALQMQSWTTVVSDLIGRFSSDMATVPALLDVLIVLPEEVRY